MFQPDAPSLPLPTEPRVPPSTPPLPAAPLRTAALDATGYVAIMAAGMAVMHHGFGFSYGQPEMMLVIGPVEVLLTLWAIRAARRQGGLAECGLGPVRRGGLWWALPLALPAAAGLASFAFAAARVGLPPGGGTLVLAAAATTGLVGLSEELMFRGVLLSAARREGGLFRAMFLSALGFMLLHAVNVLGGSPPEAVAVQLALTFLFGLCFAPVAVRLGSIWPLVLIHWAWDFMLYGHALVGASPGPAALAMGPLMLATAAAGWWSLRGERAPAPG